MSETLHVFTVYVHYVEYIKVCLLGTSQPLTSWRVLKNPSVIVVSRNDLQFRLGDGLSHGAASDHLHLAGVVLARLGDVHMVHSVVGELVSGPVDHGVSVDQPHHPRTWMAGDSTAEPSPLSFLHCTGFRFAHEDGGGARFALLRGVLRYPTRAQWKPSLAGNSTKLTLARRLPVP
jgi:hypothetical protein